MRQILTDQQRGGLLYGFARLSIAGREATAALKSLGRAMRSAQRAGLIGGGSKGWRRHVRRIKAAERG